MVSGLMLGGWYWGYLFAAVTYQYIYPIFNGTSYGWRVMFWVAILPALITFWIRRRVPESPVWLERQRMLKEAARQGRPVKEQKVPVGRIFQRDLLLTTLHTTAVIGSFMCIYYSVNFWYPRFLQDAGRPTLPYLMAFNFGAILGTAVWGRLSETRLGRRGAVTITVVVGLASLPLYLQATTPLMLGLGALLMGSFGMGVWGMAPAYTNERFPTFVRGVGPGFCYHAAAAIGAMMPTVLGVLKDRGLKLTSAMSLAMLISGISAGILIWLGPETRGRSFSADDK
jgi:SHS family lactate transporter-like MFS transporter